MRDAFGSTFMFRLIIIFIVAYVTFATIAVSYAKTFRLRNDVISLIEKKQFNYTGSASKDSGFQELNVVREIDKYLKNNAYDYKDVVENECYSQTDVNGRQAQITKQGACILPIAYSRGNTTHYYYRVTLYMVVRIPLINYNAIIPISGDTEDFNIRL